MKKTIHIKSAIIFCLCSLSVCSQQPALLIHRILGNPTGTDSPYELVELVATRSINFATEPYTVVTADGGNATTNGWISGGTGSYGFQISSGTIQKGELIYVGGSSLAVDGTNCKLLRTINTLTTAGDVLGTPSNGVVGNGGTTADGVAVFNAMAGDITVNTVPVDALFYGTAIGAGSTKNFKLPANDLYAGGTYGTAGNTFLGPDPAGDEYIYIASATFNTSTNTFTTSRVWNINMVRPDCNNASNITFITTLPVTFEYFTSSKTSGNTKLSWKITDNLNLKTSEVLQSSDGISFQPIYTINAVDQKHLYDYVVPVPENKTLYYKIKATELSGKIVYSPIQKISYSDFSHFTLYSNPVKQGTDVHVSFSVKGNRTINIYNTTGKLLAAVKSVDTDLKIPTAGWSKGLYILQVDNENGINESRKLIIK